MVQFKCILGTDEGEVINWLKVLRFHSQELQKPKRLLSSFKVLLTSTFLDLEHL